MDSVRIRVDGSVRMDAEDRKTRIALAHYIARPPLSLEKLTYEPSQAKLIFHTTFNPALGENVKLWDALQFIAMATQFIPPQGVRLIRYFGLYSSRSRWKWPQWDHLTAHAPQGWKQTPGRQGEG